MTKFYQDLFGKLDCYMRDKNSPEINILNLKTIWLIYRFLNEESKRVMLDYKSSTFLCEEFLILDNFILSFCLNKYSYI